MERLNSGWERGGKSTKPAMKGTKSLEEKLKGTDFKILEICIEKKKRKGNGSWPVSLLLVCIYYMCMHVYTVCMFIYHPTFPLPLSLSQASSTTLPLPSPAL